ncbi:MAG: hypothetical protein ACTTKC_02945 [Treponema sp.]|uniref:hypothetical protein n=1 Tax=Treponema sp. TaxID=166 RepID=UPI003FA2DBDC
MALSSQLFQNRTSYSVLNSGFEQSSKPIISSFTVHPCTEHKDSIEHTAVSYIDRVLRGGKPLSCAGK